MSGGGMPELGSKISLISKADIRYEGRLYTVDPQECTIALSSVRSFGTEDRETQFQIAPQSQIYDYILFRGSDIKDIRVVNNNLPHPNDPAIMQVQLPNGQHIMPTHFPMPNMNTPHAPPMGAGAGYPFGGMTGTGGGLPNMAGGATGGGVGASSLAPGSGAPGPFMHMAGQQQQQQQQQQQKSQQQQKQPISVIDMLAGASRSTTPISLISRKSPSTEMGGGNQQQQQQQPQMHQQQNNAGHGGNGRDAGHKRQNQQQRGGPNNHQQQQQQQRNNNNHNDYYNHPHQQQQQQLHHNHDRRDSGRNMDNQYNHNSNYNNNQRNNHQGGQNRWNMHRGGPMNGNNMMRNRNPGGMRGRMQNQGFRPMGGTPGGIGGNQNKTRNNKIKFEQDFDFEQANNKFEELRSQLAKLKVGEDAKSSEQLDTPAAATNLQMNGEIDKKDDSGNETGAGEHEPEDEEIHVGYDKTKSFFDNISCEAAQDRSKNKKNDWRQERKLNSETFGVSSTRRGSYRGRGNYYNRNAGGGGNYTGGGPGNMGNGGGGGYRNYRGGNNQYRNRSNNRNNNHGANNNNNGGNPLNVANNNNNSAANTVAALKQQVQQQSPIVNAGSDGGVDSTTTKTTTTLREIIKPDTVKTIGQQCFANANGTESL